MNKYVLTSASKLGEKDEKFGQTWWAYVEGFNFPVMFNSMSGEFRAGDQIEYAEAVVKEGKKGEYRRLKGVKRNAGVGTPEEYSEGPTNKEIMALLKKVALAVGVESEDDIASQVEEIMNDDEPVSLDEIPF